MKTRSLAFRTGLAIALGLALGHLWSVNRYELDRISVAISTHALEPRNPSNEAVLMDRQVMSAIVGLALVCVGLLAGTRWAERIVTFVASYASMGLIVSVERADLGYAKATWPLVPWSIKQSSGSMSGVFLIILAACIFVVWREAVSHEEEKPPKQKARHRSDQQRPQRQHTVHRMRTRPKPEPEPADDEEEDEGASSED
jgi:hypothetical protein